VLASYVWRDLVRNPRRTLAALAGIALGVGLFSAVLFFIDGSSASMTQRAVAPLPIDMQRVLTAPLGGRLRLSETLDTTGRLAAGQRVTVRLDLVNESPSAANEVVLRSAPPAGLAYVPGSATVQGTAVREGARENPFARGAAQTGLNLGTVGAGGRVSASYAVEARGPVALGDGRAIQSSFSTREIVTPVRANAPDPMGPAELATRIAGVEGVAAADQLSFVDLPARSLSSGAHRIAGAVRLFAFDAGYERRHADIALVDGEQAPDGALLSVEAAQQLGVHAGDAVELLVPGATAPLRLTVSGTADLRRAKSLFYSRQGRNLEDFLYVPASVVVAPAVFDRSVVPALLAETAARGGAPAVPVREVDVQVTRDRLHADPGAALTQTRRIADSVSRIAPEQDYLIDNISNTLGVARADAALAKRMFVVLGVPGALLAAILAGNAGAVLAAAQRREQAILRVRGAGRRHLVRMLLLRSALLAGAGAAVGLAMGYLSALAVLGADALGRASTAGLVVSGVIGACGGFLAAGSALAGAGLASIRREINDDRAALFSRPPRWQRLRLDLLGLVAVAVLVVVAVSRDAFAGVPGSVYSGRGVRLDLWLLALPVGAWLAGSLVAGRLFARALTRLPGRSARFPHLVGGLLGRSLRRRSWVAAQGMVVVALIVAAATSIVLFTASYDRAKAADARFSLGSDLKVTPPAGAGIERLDSATGVAAATPVVYGVENALVHSSRDEDAANLAAVDPAGFAQVAALRDDDFVGMTADEALAALDDDPAGALLSTDLADLLQVGRGDPITVLLARDTPAQAVVEMHVVGLYERLPAFPGGAGTVVSLRAEQRAVPSSEPDFFLARTTDGRPSTLHAAVRALSTGRGMAVETRETTLDKDQSSLAALNIRGLLTLDSGFGLAMTIVAIGIFVFGLLLQRRREYVTLSAQGLQMREIRALIVGETSAVTVSACLVGLIVGVGMAVLLVAVLRPLFVLTPGLALPLGGVLALIGLVIAATLVASVAASGLVARLRATELLRDE
jgi:putative ABC transport system permease protein